MNEAAINLAAYKITTLTRIRLLLQVLDGIYCIRFSIGNQFTKRSHVLASWDVINQEAGKLLTGSA